MYRTFYGLQDKPFDVTPDPKYLLLTPTHREALHMLEYGVRARKGVILLGEEVCRDFDFAAASEAPPEAESAAVTEGVSEVAG